MGLFVSIDKASGPITENVTKTKRMRNNIIINGEKMSAIIESFKKFIFEFLE